MTDFDLKPQDLMRCGDFVDLVSRYNVIEAGSQETGEGMFGCLMDDEHFMTMLENLICAARPQPQPEPESLGDRLYREIERRNHTIDGWPLLPDGWEYDLTNGAGGVGASHSSGISVMVTPGYDNPDDPAETPVDVHYEGEGEIVGIHERWTLPQVDFKHWQHLLFHLCQRFTWSGVTLKARLETWESPIRGNCIRAHTPFGNFIVENVEDSPIDYQNFVVEGREFWVHFHPQDQFCNIVGEPKPWATMPAEIPQQ